MVKSTPLLRKRIVKKRTLKFTRFQSDLYGGRLAESWRRPRGTLINNTRYRQQNASSLQRQQKDAQNWLWFRCDYQVFPSQRP